MSGMGTGSTLTRKKKIFPTGQYEVAQGGGAWTVGHNEVSIVTPAKRRSVSKSDAKKRPAKRQKVAKAKATKARAGNDDSEDDDETVEYEKSSEQLGGDEHLLGFQELNYPVLSPQVPNPHVSDEQRVADVEEDCAALTEKGVEHLGTAIFKRLSSADKEALTADGFALMVAEKLGVPLMLDPNLLRAPIFRIPVWLGS